MAASDRPQAVWSALAEIFGTPLVTNYGAEPPPLWRNRIDELSDAQIRHGLKALSEKPTPHPPTLGEFTQACRGNGSPRMLGQDLPVDAARRLEGPPKPGSHGLPPGMSPLAYASAANKASGQFPYIAGTYYRPSSLPVKLHAQYLAGKFENVREHGAYLRAHDDEARLLSIEFLHKWGVTVDVSAAAAAWPA